MKLTYDPRANAAYIYIRDDHPRVEVETLELSDEVNVDIAPDGSVFGIELLNAKEQFKAGAESALVLVNQLLNKTEKVLLP